MTDQQEFLRLEGETELVGFTSAGFRGTQKFPDVDGLVDLIRPRLSGMLP